MPTPRKTTRPTPRPPPRRRDPRTDPPAEPPPRMPDDHPYGWLSLAPPAATVLLAIVTKRAVLSLLIGLFVGALILTGGNPYAALIETLETHLWATLADPWQLRLFGFLVLIGAMIGVVNRSGGMHGLVRLITPLARTRRSGQMATWLAGLIVFFDDYTNTLLVGATMRSTCDRLRISREKLAYLVDSTAAPVAGLALLSTWVAVEIDFIKDGLQACEPALVEGYTPLDVFLGCIPYRFYIIQALLFVPIVALVGRDFGPMRRAEQEASERGGASDPAGADQDPQQSPIRPSHWANAVVPLAVTLAVVLALLVQTGRVGATPEMLAGLGFWGRAQVVFGQADTPLALFYGAGIGLATAWGMAVGRRLISPANAADAAYGGVRAIVPGMMILLLATTLAGMTQPGEPPSGQTDDPFPNRAERLYTGAFLQSLLPTAEENQAASTAIALSLPTVVFLMAAVVAFSTGTSFGTMGILFPVIAPVAFASLGPAAGEMFSEPMLLATFGAVLSGAIFGDHCSPISDTTVLSSQASGCDHVAHVVTQMPYALTVAGVCVLLGTAPLALGVPVLVLLPLQTAALVAIALFCGQRIEEPAAAQPVTAPPVADLPAQAVRDA
ncbi:MAG: Na+/H+ antiporter NhaC family protein [Planctomycetota bacterium]